MPEVESIDIVRNVLIADDTAELPSPDHPDNRAPYAPETDVFTFHMRALPETSDFFGVYHTGIRYNDTRVRREDGLTDYYDDVIRVDIHLNPPVQVAGQTAGAALPSLLIAIRRKLIDKLIYTSASNPISLVDNILDSDILMLNSRQLAWFGLFRVKGCYSLS